MQLALGVGRPIQEPSSVRRRIGLTKLDIVPADARCIAIPDRLWGKAASKQVPIAVVEA